MGKKEDSLEDVLGLFKRVEDSIREAEEAVKKAQESVRPMDRLIDELAKGRVITRKRKRPKMHWKTRRRKQREYYARAEAPRRKKRLAAQLAEGPGGWYRFLRKQWLQMKVRVVLTEEEFTEKVWPFIDGYVFTVRRYDTKGPISLENIWIEDCDSRDVLWDGKEYKLKELGMIL